MPAEDGMILTDFLLPFQGFDVVEPPQAGSLSAGASWLGWPQVTLGRKCRAGPCRRSIAMRFLDVGEISWIELLANWKMLQGDVGTFAGSASQRAHHVHSNQEAVQMVEWTTWSCQCLARQNIRLRTTPPLGGITMAEGVFDGTHGRQRSGRWCRPRRFARKGPGVARITPTQE